MKPATHPQKIKVDDEAALIESLHDAQMAAPEGRQLYYRLHKELTPSIIRVLHEAAQASNSKRAMADTLINLSEFFASAIMSAASFSGGPGAARVKERQAIALSLTEMIKDFIENRLDLLREDDT